MRVSALSAWLIAAVSTLVLAPANARKFVPADASTPHALPFTATLSNNIPLAFGMDVEDTARALGSPLNYISSRPGDEIFMAFRNVGGSGLFHRNDRLYLQFRQGRLAGWKGDWGHNWMWQ